MKINTGSLLLKLESEVDILLSNICEDETEIKETNVLSKLKFDFLINKVYDNLNFLDDINLLNQMLSSYSKKVYVYLDLINSHFKNSDELKSTFLFLLRKYWIIMNSLAKKIGFLNGANNIISCLMKGYNEKFSDNIMNDIIHIYFPLLIYFNSELNILFLHSSLNIHFDYFCEIKLVTKYKTLKNASNFVFSKQFFKDNKKFCLKQNNLQKTSKLDSEIQLLTLERKTCAVLNMFTSRDQDSNESRLFNNNNCFLNLCREYFQLNYEELLIKRILKSENLPSKKLRCEAIFVLISSITDTKLFEKIFKALISNTLDDFSIIYQVCVKYHSSLEKAREQEESIKVKKKSDLWNKMRNYIWEHILKLINGNYSYFHRIQGIILTYCLLSEYNWRNYSNDDFLQDFNLIFLILTKIIEKIHDFVKSDILKYVLERNILINPSIYSEKSILSFDLVKLLGSISTVYSISEENAKSAFYQLIANILFDKFILKNFQNLVNLKTFNELFFKLSLENLFLKKNLQVFLFLFGFIPTQLIFSHINYIEEKEVNISEIFGFSPRMVHESKFYNNSIKFIKLFTSLLFDIRRDKDSNLKILILIYIEFLKKLFRQFKSKSVISQDFNTSEDDIYHSYFILHEYLYFFLKYENYQSEEHLLRTLKSIPKPEILKNLD